MQGTALRQQRALVDERADEVGQFVLWVLDPRDVQITREGAGAAPAEDDFGGLARAVLLGVDEGLRRAIALLSSTCPFSSTSFSARGTLENNVSKRSEAPSATR